jgi:hypothetical protein
MLGSWSRLQPICESALDLGVARFWIPPAQISAHELVGELVKVECSLHPPPHLGIADRFHLPDFTSI